MHFDVQFCIIQRISPYHTYKIEVQSGRALCTRQQNHAPRVQGALLLSDNALRIDINLVTGKVALGDLVGALRNTTGHGTVKKQLGRVQAKQKLLNTPLAKNEQDKVRIMTRDLVCKKCGFELPD